MRVAVLVHNDVVKDARVRKEVATLVSAGHLVDVYGLFKGAGQLYPTTIEGANLILTEYDGRVSRGSLGLWLERLRVILEFIAFVGVMSVIAHLVVTRGTWSLPYAVMLVPALLLVWANTLKSNSRKRRTGKKFLKVISLLVFIFLSSILLYISHLTAVLFVLLNTLAFAIFRYSVRPRHAAEMLRRIRKKLMPNARRVRMTMLARILSNRVRERDYDVLHCHDIIGLLAGASIKRRDQNLRLIWDAHEIYESLANTDPSYGKMMRQFILSCQGEIDEFITISESFAEFYSKNYQLPKPAIIMNATRMAGEVQDDGRLRRAAGLSPDRKILLFQGGLSHERGLPQLAQAAERLPEPWSIVLMGWGALENDLKGRAASLEALHPQGAAPLALIPAASQDELAHWTAGASVGIIPYENTSINHLYCTPNKLWEFPNAGVPILATSLVEMERMISRWGTGFLLPRDFTADDIVRFLGSVTDDEILSAKNKCRVFSHQMSWNQFEPILLEVYGRFAGGKP